MRDPVLSALRCPHCGQTLVVSDVALVCAARHSFDIARSGYVNLLRGKAPAAADTPEMVAARTAFLGAGHYLPIARAVSTIVADATQDSSCPLILDAGAGTGWYLAHVLEAIPEAQGLGLDISKVAAARCAHAHERLGAVVADTWGQLPVADDSMSVVLSIFAPRNPAEFARVLAPGGRVVVVSAAPDHLAELVAPLDLIGIDPEKDSRIAASFESAFETVSRHDVDFTVGLSRDDARALALMGPSAHHADRERLDAALCALDEPIAARVSVTIRVFVSCA